MPVGARSVRLFALVSAHVLHPKTRHVIGWPPELSDEGSEVQHLPSPDVLVIEQESEGSVFLYRMTRTGAASGDTWHQSIEDAKHQAEHEYGKGLGEWRAVPDDVADARGFAIETIR